MSCRVKDKLQTMESLPNKMQNDFYLSSLEQSHDYFQNQSSRTKNQLQSKQSNKNDLIQNTIQWTAKHEERFMILHKIHGNLWALLSRKLNGFCSSFLKNHFYGRLRKSVRKLNVKIISHFSKAYAPFNLNIIFKLSNISEGKIQGKCGIQEEISQYYKKFIYTLIEFYGHESQVDESEEMKTIENLILPLIALDNLFRFISGERYYKGKKKNISYLKHFNFPMDHLSSIYLVIGKQKCYISSQVANTQKIMQKRTMIDQSQAFCSQDSQNSFSFMYFCQKYEQKSQQSSKQIHSVLMEPTKRSQSQLTSIDDFTVLDQELREFDQNMGSSKYFCPQTLFDSYGGKKFDYFDT